MINAKLKGWNLISKLRWRVESKPKAKMGGGIKLKLRWRVYSKSKAKMGGGGGNKPNVKRGG